MSAIPPMRVRCPADDPADPGAHLALDVRLPLKIGKHFDVLARLRCPCGGRMVVELQPAQTPSGGEPLTPAAPCGVLPP